MTKNKKKRGRDSLVHEKDKIDYATHRGCDPRSMYHGISNLVNLGLSPGASRPSRARGGQASATRL